MQGTTSATPPDKESGSDRPARLGHTHLDAGAGDAANMSIDG